MGFNCLKASSTSRRQFTFYHEVPRCSWYSFYRPWKDERLSRPWSHPMVNFPLWACQFDQIRMGDNTNLFNLSESAINAIKKPQLVQKIIALKGKVIMDSDISNLCNQISKLSDTISQLHSTNLTVVKM